MRRRTWVAGGLAVVLVLAAAAVLGVRGHEGSCGRAVTRVSAAHSSSPFLAAAGRSRQPDAKRDRAVAALSRATTPFGSVVGAVGYDYEQWAQLSAYAGGLGVRTRDNPDFTLLDERTLEPRWSVQVSTKRSTYDADGSRYLVATMPKSGSPDIVAMSLRDGRRLWCTSLGGPVVHQSDPFATALIGNDVVVLGPGPDGASLSSFDRHGKRRWKESVEAGHGDYLGTFGDLLLVGGDEQYRLADPALRGRLRDRVAVSAVSPSDGKAAWGLGAEAGIGLHVVGVDGSIAVIERADRAGAWLEAALRSGRVLVRSGARWSAYDAATGHRTWARTLPTSPQLLPYGFSLDQLPMLDQDHALVGTTTALRVMDLRTGAWGPEAALPTDGINTTYWPYAVVVTDHLIGVATNTSAVVLRREDDGAGG